MASLEEQFKAAGDHFAPIASGYSDRQKLRMYGLWNQATNGDVTGSQPSKLKSIRKWAKYEAWKKCKGMSKELAMKRYISELRSLDPDWTIKGDNLDSTDNGLIKPKKGNSKIKKRKPVAKTGQALAKEFEQAANFVRHTNRFESFKSQQTLLYGYYKQATEGPCKRPAPSVFSGRLVYAKWKAWGNLFDMPQEEAMRLYIAQVRKIVPEFNGTDQSARELLQQEEVAVDIGDLDDDEILDLITKVSPGSLKDRMKAASEAGGTIYLMTGATGFIGKHLLGCLVERNRNSLMICISRPTSTSRLAKQVLERHGKEGAAQVVALGGNISKPNFELGKQFLSVLQTAGDGVSHFIHLAASYDMTASPEVNRLANVEGTRYAMQMAETLRAKFEYTSSIVVAGDFNGMFLESNFDEGQQFKNPYAETKFEAEKLVRKECKAPYRIYRPGVVVGHSQTGEADKIDGPYYFFKTLQRMRKVLPSSLTLPCVDGDGMPIVPVDYVAKAMDIIIHTSDNKLDSRAYHLVDPSPDSFLETLNHFAKAAHAPTFSARIPTIAEALIPRKVFAAIERIPLVNNAPAFFAKNVFRIPESLVDYIDFRTTYDDSDTQEVLYGSGVRCPPLKSYAWRLWDYYERFMDIRNLDPTKALQIAVANKVVVVTGSTDGIGLVLAKRLAKCGAHVCLVARNKDKLSTVKNEIEKGGGNCSAYVADLSKEDSTNKMIDKVLKDHGYVDILVNNAGRSIRRSVEYQYKGTGRFHDFTRTIELNYYGSLRCILGFLPEMRKRKSGQIINVSSIGAVTNAPRFGAYIASKSALDGFTRCISSEVAADDIALTTVYMPLVQTKMVVSKGNKFDHMDLLTPKEASAMIERAMVTRERTISTQTGKLVSAGYYIWPSMVESVLTILYKLEPEQAPSGIEPSDAAKGDKEQLRAIGNLLKGAI
mmetsp:Transcript_12034/g.15680  ORF Transcript_12034/g.15680 Transcript_12034/m.15680 type:complete len:937 (+) Transcript_12034:205-3015(+)|eukprot:CAMPEP_0204876114 /NCGR_PEP_ID=MMETSP1348-20121228/47455_1 /ASSEMBLY_ACC=CAM_ASM_000700 /TAXON_ID=215587 /ORGANISM="Aplanochytrium stocchinoi, Strain GSBS06" /LENGTH=936 /DNA_ID=CAMNT_0052032835 /DNA_START=129 /DNA_END=2939 /DNA_ORIENTATION=-